MQTLVIHPKDATTDFLKPIYENLQCTVITGGCTKAEVYNKVAEHDRIIMLGHGSPLGLFAVGQFINEGRLDYIIDESFKELLQKKKNNVYIWCHANRFVQGHNLSGFYTGMFISETLEAVLYNIDAKENEIHLSNNLFSALVGDVITKNAEGIYNHIKSNFCLADNQVLNFNYERIYYRLEEE